MSSFREIRIEDRNRFIKMQKDQHYENNEGSFATIFLWRHRWRIEISVDDDILYLRACLPEDGSPMHYQPIVPAGESVRKALDVIEDELAQQDAPLLIKYVNDSFVERLSEEGAGEYNIIKTRDEFDYVYSTEDLANLTGRKFHGQRNHLNYFLREYGYRYEELTSGHLNDCMTIYDRWMEEHTGKLIEEGERIAVWEAVTHLEALGLMGGIVYVESTPVAFTVGECFRHNMALIHLEKADPRYRGAFQFINQQFVYRKLKDLTYVNRQEDMGVEGIRKAKLAYHPVRMIEKYDIVRK